MRAARICYSTPGQAFQIHLMPPRPKGRRFPRSDAGTPARSQFRWMTPYPESRPSQSRPVSAPGSVGRARSTWVLLLIVGGDIAITQQRHFSLPSAGVLSILAVNGEAFRAFLVNFHEFPESADAGQFPLSNSGGRFAGLPSQKVSCRHRPCLTLGDQRPGHLFQLFAAVLHSGERRQDLFLIQAQRGHDSDR